MSQLENMKISVNSLMNETKRLSQLLISKHTTLIFFYNILLTDIDYENYCSLYASIKVYAATIPSDANTTIVKEKIDELPPLSTKDFAYSDLHFPTIILFLLLPFGIVVWVINFIHLTKLTDKIRSIERTLGTIDFMLKALTN
jgi:hypothetical protein